MPILIIWTMLFLFVTIKRCTFKSGIPFKICESLCDVQGREALSIEPKGAGVFVKCYCGQTKKIKDDMSQP